MYGVKHMFRKNDWEFDWSELMTGVIFLVVAYFLFKKPGVALSGFVMVIALAAIIRGIAKLSAYRHLREDTGIRATLMLINAILDIILGFLFIFNVPVGIISISYVFAAWFLVDAIVGLLNVGHLKQFNLFLYVVSIILDILGIVVGLLLLMNPVVTAVTLATLVGFYFAILGVNAIVIAFARRM
ncbi:putative integral membrane protein [Latilactobacillus fuchuensis]|uniref:Integral membrane protein n=2 Tax=Latilactobacillus fuchuensis TaxID=164393 RepID=A0A2N9DU69_9LACO|nr:putative integral membrane protein [Latilactobacillus fuchuensis]